MRASRLRTSSGQSLLEFVLMMPFLLIIFMGIFEFSQILVKNIRLSSLSREAAIAINRNCIKSTTSLETQATAQACLDQVRDWTSGLAEYAFKDFAARGQFIITIYDRATGTVIATSQSPGTHLTKYNAAKITASGMDAAVFPIVGVSEIYFDNPLHTPLEPLLNMVLPQLLYKSTVV